MLAAAAARPWWHRHKSALDDAARFAAHGAQMRRHRQQRKKKEDPKQCDKGPLYVLKPHNQKARSDRQPLEKKLSVDLLCSRAQRLWFSRAPARRNSGACRRKEPPRATWRQKGMPAATRGRRNVTLFPHWSARPSFFLVSPPAVLGILFALARVLFCGLFILR
ncbi:hypothetical protein TW95_gp0374 [Pandoravirus inopinatum]|uniref:Uncharacterized protein n=1 Tax=Pandoravirus inopinatum TaxID=1605721 RepID=A0A0B5IWN1_9VIRU|nr:hypothetical protein TW95_gp0374 [Pandoravirus inopinatum]AJF97108.1 hypothetical protein [Pandoravirus inopinatum]